MQSNSPNRLVMFLEKDTAGSNLAIDLLFLKYVYTYFNFYFLFLFFQNLFLSSAYLYKNLKASDIYACILTSHSRVSGPQL